MPLYLSAPAAAQQMMEDSVVYQIREHAKYATQTSHLGLKTTGIPTLVIDTGIARALNVGFEAVPATTPRASGSGVNETNNGGTLVDLGAVAVDGGGSALPVPRLYNGPFIHVPRPPPPPYPPPPAPQATGTVNNPQTPVEGQATSSDVGLASFNPNNLLRSVYNDPFSIDDVPRSDPLLTGRHNLPNGRIPRLTRRALAPFNGPSANVLHSPPAQSQKSPPTAAPAPPAAPTQEIYESEEEDLYTDKY